MKRTMKRLLPIALLGATLLLAGGCDYSHCNDCGGIVLEDKPLRGTTWQIAGFEGHGDAIEEAQSTLVLSPDTLVFEGKAACNTYIGTYQVDAGSGALSLDVEAITEIGCGLREYESDLLEALEATASYEVSGDSLILYEANDETLEFIAAEEGR